MYEYYTHINLLYIVCLFLTSQVPDPWPAFYQSNLLK
jgi:hypothetical protein